MHNNMHYYLQASIHTQVIIRTRSSNMHIYICIAAVVTRLSAYILMSRYRDRSWSCLAFVSSSSTVKTTIQRGKVFPVKPFFGLTSSFLIMMSHSVIHKLQRQESVHNRKFSYASACVSATFGHLGKKIILASNMLKHNIMHTRDPKYAYQLEWYSYLSYCRTNLQ